MRVLAVDLGAGSGRVMAVDLDAAPPVLQEVTRFAHHPVRHDDGSLRWDWDGIVDKVEVGLRAGVAAGPVASIGIDTWGVDYGLVDERGALLSPPHSYRSERTAGWREVVDRIGADTLYRTTGIQLMAINTVFQLAVHDRRELDRAAAVLLLPELVACALTGTVVGERTSAGTTALVDLETGTWSPELVAATGADPAIFPPIRQPGTPIGAWSGIPVHLVGGHDTASAVAALAGPPPAGTVFVSSGTWMLVGTERPGPDVSATAQAANFSNEAGVDGGFRLLKNVMGLWMLEQCREAWGSPPVGELLEAATEQPGGPVVDATDERFLAPADMEAEVREAGGLGPSAARAAVVRCILDSLAAAAARVIDEIEQLTGATVPEVHVVGGGVRNQLLNRLVAEASGRPVVEGAAEATALGNALVQGVATGRFASLDEARTALTVPSP